MQFGNRFRFFQTGISWSLACGQNCIVSQLPAKLGLDALDVLIVSHAVIIVIDTTDNIEQIQLRISVTAHRFRIKIRCGFSHAGSIAI